MAPDSALCTRFVLDQALYPRAPVMAAGTAFELLRAIVGRRSRRQAGELRWDEADEVAIEVFAVYGWRSDDLDE